MIYIVYLFVISSLNFVIFIIIFLSLLLLLTIALFNNIISNHLYNNFNVIKYFKLFIIISVIIQIFSVIISYNI